MGREVSREKRSLSLMQGPRGLGKSYRDDQRAVGMSKAQRGLIQR